MGLTAFLLTMLMGLFSYLYLKMKDKHRHWQKRGVAFAPPKPIFGSSSFPPKMTMGEMQVDIYNQFPNEKKVGYYEFLLPVLLIRDPELIERVLVKDFGSFSDHGFDLDEEKNPLEVSLFTMNGNKWRALRNKVTPVFTTGKLRGMTPMMVDAFKTTLEQFPNDGDLEIKEFFASYATIVFGSCVFGIDTKDISKSDSEFRQMNKTMFEMNTVQFLRVMLFMGFPKLAKKLGIGFMPKNSLRYFERIVVETMEQRRRNPSLKRNDFIQTLLQLRDKGTLEFHMKDPDDDYLLSVEHETVESFEMTDSLVVSQAVSFLMSGFEALALVMMYFCFEVARNPEIQERLRREVNEKIEANQGKIDYDTIKSMTYLDQCMQETLRMYPIAQSLMRVATKPCELDGVHLDPGNQVFIPIMALHMDPNYFPDPEVFNPDRFAPGQQCIKPFTYLPFGDGPRMCIGMRFTLLEMKLGVALAVRNYELKLSPETQLPFVYSPYNMVLSPKQKVILHLTKLCPGLGRSNKLMGKDYEGGLSTTNLA